MTIKQAAAMYAQVTEQINELSMVKERLKVAGQFLIDSGSLFPLDREDLEMIYKIIGI